MANIPVIPGVKVSTKGILNKPLKDIICALLFGGLNNMLKGPLICVSADLDKLISEYTDLPNLQDLKNELKELKEKTPEWIKSEPIFKQMGVKRFKELTNVPA